MSAPRVECFFDVGSPASHLAWSQLPALCASAGAVLAPRPMLLGGVFQATQNASPMAVPAKGRYTMTDLQRHARRYGVALEPNPHFPVNTLLAMRVLTGVLLRQPERFASATDALFRALWVEGANLADPAALGQALSAAQVDPAPALAAAGDADVKTALRTTTEEAVARGVFGAPTMFVGDEMFFGQDRLEWVREAVLARA
jgi:2-hydroxychromene-2-carboxylate isomerase